MHSALISSSILTKFSTKMAPGKMLVVVVVVVVVIVVVEFMAFFTTVALLVYLPKKSPKGPLGP